uniref:Uncharacterized protein n=1 Tax=Arundo donax TaxID=35708 RepID=A0A0A9BAS7_ARUDO
MGAAAPSATTVPLPQSSSVGSRRFPLRTPSAAPTPLCGLVVAARSSAAVVATQSSATVAPFVLCLDVHRKPNTVPA